jgi:hypothetical protein
MLAEVQESATFNWTATDVADHYGSAPATDDVDDVSTWPDAKAAAASGTSTK